MGADFILIFDRHEDRITCYGWDGTLRWQIPKLWPSYSDAISPDGQIYADTTIVNGIRHVRSWIAGRPQPAVALPPGKNDLSLAVTSSGDIIAWDHAAVSQTVFLLRRGRLIAHGKLPSQLLYDQDDTLFTEKGDGVYSHDVGTDRTLTFSRLSVSGTSLRITPVYTGPLGSQGFVSLLAGDIALTSDGGRYAPTGCLCQSASNLSDPWILNIGEGSQTYLQQDGPPYWENGTDPTRDIAITYPDGRIAWRLPRRAHNVFAVSDTGRFVAVEDHASIGPAQSKILALARKIPWLGSRLPEPGHSLFRVYRNPWRAVAVLSGDVFERADPHPYKYLSPDEGRFSKNGRTLHILSVSPMSEDHSMALMHFTW
ncbi:MAG: hypothetical protein ACYDCO_18825 [Armatimonadota bacterium]